jgi:hypothetical protein
MRVGVGVGVCVRVINPVTETWGGGANATAYGP